MSNKDWKEQEDDCLSRRRRLIPRERKKEFDSTYNISTSSRGRNTGGAGKGDTPRNIDKEIYDAGYDITHGATPKIRREAEARWRRLRRERGAGRDT